MKALVTGGTGFIGPHLIKELGRLGMEVYLLCRGCKTQPDKRIIQADLTDSKELKKTLENMDFDYVFHLGGLTKPPKIKTDEDLFYKINVIGTKNLVEALRKKNIKRFVYFSSVDCLGLKPKKNGMVVDENTISAAEKAYDLSKLKAEELLKNYYTRINLPIVIIRPGAAYGEGKIDLSKMRINEFVFKLIILLKKKRCPIIGNGNNYFPLTYVGNIIQVVTLIIKNDKAIGQIYIVTDDKSYTMNEIIKAISNILGIKYKGIHIPLLMSIIITKITEAVFKVLRKNPPLTMSGIEYLTSNRIFSVEKAKRELGYSPVSLRDGIKKTISWYKQNGYL